MTPRRGDVWLVDFGQPIGREQAGRRPALIISDDELNEGPGGLVIVVPITSTSRGLPSHIDIDDAQSGLDDISYAKTEDVKSVSEQRMVRRLGVAPVASVFGVERALRFLLGL